MFGQGDVTLSDSAHGDAFRPWMSGRVGGDRLVLVQQPTLPALMALSEALFGTMRIALAAIAAAAVVAMYALTNALLRDLRIAVVASACFVLSPLVMVQSAMFVSYVLAVSLTAASLALLTRGLDRQTQGQRSRPVTHSRSHCGRSAATTRSDSGCAQLPNTLNSFTLDRGRPGLRCG